MAESTMFSDVEKKLKKKNKILFSRDSECLQELKMLIEQQEHRTLVVWALDCAKIPLAQFEEKYPQELRPRRALDLCEKWSRGKIKMPVAKRAILDAHAVAKEMDDKVCGALCHAIGHAGATVHVETHALGLVFYELTALVLQFGKDEYQKPVSAKINDYCERLIYWQENIDRLDLEWASFLMDDNKPNKEKIKQNNIQISQKRSDEELQKFVVGELTPQNAQITLVEYDLNWPKAFTQEADRIRSILGDKVIQLEHVGSTSVPGLCAKPIIDILLVVKKSSDEPSYVPDLEKAGYILRIRELGWFEHRMFKGPDTDINLHVFSEGEPEADRMLLFRNWLRSNEADRYKYAQVKRSLAKNKWRHVQHYADSKTSIVQEIMNRANGIE